MLRRLRSITLALVAGALLQPAHATAAAEITAVPIPKPAYIVARAGTGVPARQSVVPASVVRADPAAHIRPSPRTATVPIERPAALIPEETEAPASEPLIIAAVLRAHPPAQVQVAPEIAAVPKPRPAQERTSSGDPAPESGAAAASASLSPAAKAETPAVSADPLSVADDVYSVPFPVVVGTRQFSPVPAQATTSRLVAVDPSALAEAISGVLEDDSRERLARLGDGFVPVAEIEELVGLSLTLDTGALVIRAEATAQGVIAAEKISLAIDDPYADLDRIEPGFVAAGLTTVLDVTYDFEGDEEPGVLGVFDGFVNVGGDEGVNLDFAFDLAPVADEEFFRRGPMLAFHDDRERAIRYAAGDVFSRATGLAGGINLLGLGVERLYDVIQPGRTLQPLGNRQFILQRRSQVEVYVNGILVRSFTAGPGPIDLRDIPFVDTNNNVEIVVEDVLGRRAIANFSFATNLELLPEGLTDFSVTGGLLPELGADVFEYTGDPAGTAFVRHGLTGNLTAFAEAHGSEDFQAVGGGFALAPGFGIMALDAIGTMLDGDQGFAASVTYQADFDGLFRGRDQFHFLAEYFSEDYAQLGISEPIEGIEMNVLADYRMSVTPDLSLSFGYNHQTDHLVDGASEIVSLGASYRYESWLFSALLRQSLGRETETDAFLGITYRFGRRGTARGSFDTSSMRAAVEARRTARDQIGDYGYHVRAERDLDDSETFVTGSARYISNRVDVEAGVARTFDPRGTGQSFGSVRLQSGIAFVDGHLGIGRDPGDGFYLVGRHPTLEDAIITAGEDFEGNPRAYADLLGPAVVPVRRPYSSEPLRVGAEGGPAGYDIGAGQYVAQPGARNGYYVRVGSDAYRSAVGRMLIDGAPAALVYASVRRADAEGDLVETFTNRAGVFAVSNLAPGEYILKIAGRNLVSRFAVAEDAPAFIQIGDVSMTR